MTRSSGVLELSTPVATLESEQTTFDFMRVVRERMFAALAQRLAATAHPQRSYTIRFQEETHTDAQFHFTYVFFRIPLLLQDPYLAEVGDWVDEQFMPVVRSGQYEQAMLKQGPQHESGPEIVSMRFEYHPQHHAWERIA